MNEPIFELVMRFGKAHFKYGQESIRPDGDAYKTVLAKDEATEAFNALSKAIRKECSHLIAD